MTDKTDLQRYLESAGQRLAAQPTAPMMPDEIILRWPIGNWASTEAAVTLHDERRGKLCVPGEILDVSGMGITGRNGTAEISLREFHCYNLAGETGEKRLYSHPINVILTSRESKPVHLATEVTITPDNPQTANDEHDVIIKVRAWDRSAAPLSDARFFWRCSVYIAVQGE